MITRDDNPDEVSLPPHLTKHRCYANWCWEQGWKVSMKSRAQTMYQALSNYEQRPNDDEAEVPLWPSGSETKKVCSWFKFLHFWKAHYSNIKVRAKGADTCTDCMILIYGLKKIVAPITGEIENHVIDWIQDIKQVEMYTKWRHLLPDYAKDVTCPKPSDTVIKKIRDERNAKAKARQNKGEANQSVKGDKNVESSDIIIEK
mmetsp:Transcript_29631/g.43117  ORF Transcript_29631/g.43117 Transcript_29631/m.43117 type:complete len:202 (+) Transcript_29631:254-859(+)